MAFREPQIKPTSIYCTLDEVVTAALLSIYDDAGINRERFEHFGMRGWKEEIVTDVIRGTKKTFIPVSSTTKVAVLPKDFVDYARLGIIDTSNNFQALSENTNLTPPAELITNVPTEGCGCECGCASEICSDLLSISTTYEDVVMSGVTTDLEGQCNYEYDIAIYMAGFPFSIAITQDGVLQTAVLITNQAGLDAYFAVYGFTKTSNTFYSITETDIVYGNIVISYTAIEAPPVTATISYQQATYAITAPVNVTGVSAVLGGVTYPTAAVIPTLSRLLYYINSRNSGNGFLSDLGTSLLGTVNSSTANYFGNITLNTGGVPTVVTPTQVLPKTNNTTFDLSGVTFPIASASIVMNNIITTNSSPIASLAALVSWLDSQGRGSFVQSGTDIVVTHPLYQVSTGLITFPTTSFTQQINFVNHTTNTPLADVYAITDYLNTILVGQFYTDGSIIYLIGYNGSIALGNLEATWSGGSAQPTWTITSKQGSMYVIGALSVEEYINQNIVTIPGTCTFQKTTKIKTCSNGDVVQEITQPVSVVTQVSTCDYDIDIDFPCTACDYLLEVSDDPTFPISNVSYYKNGINTIVGAVTNETELDALMDGLGFTKTEDFTYALLNTCDTWTSFTYTDPVSSTLYFERTNCVESSTLGFPYTIESYVFNGVVTEVGTVITNQAALDAFFSGIEFTKDSATHYHKNDTANTYSSLEICIETSPATRAQATINLAIAPIDGDTFTIHFPVNGVTPATDIVFTFKTVAVADTDILIDPSLTIQGLIFANLVGSHFVGEDVDLFLDIDPVDRLVHTFIVGNGGINTSGGAFDGAIGNDITLSWTRNIFSETPPVNLEGGEDAEQECFVLDFEQSECVITHTTEVEMQTTTETVCHLTVRDCGCVEDTPENIATCHSCFGCYPCCWNWQSGDLPYAENGYGSYDMIKESGLLQLSPSFPYSKIYLEYYSDGFLGADGKYYIHVFAKPALVAYILWQAIEYKKVPNVDKERRKQEWIGNRNRARRRISRVNLQELYDAVRTLPIV